MSDSKHADGNEPFFVIGTQRSGTTLLSQILNMHPSLYCLNELSLGEELAGLWEAYEKLNEKPGDGARFEKVLMRRLTITEPYLPPDEVNDKTILEHIEKALGKKARSLGKARWGIKDPMLTYFMEVFYKRYPNGKFIFIARDARAVCHSHLNQKENIANVFYGAQLWAKEIRRQREFIDAHPGSSLCLRYEDLLEDPKRELKRIMHFLGENYLEELLRYHEIPPGIGIHQGNINVTKPLDRTLAFKWRHVLNKDQLNVIQAVAGDLMQTLGYRVIGVRKPPGSLKRMGYSIHQWVLINYWWQRRSRFYGLRKRLQWPRQIIDASYAWIRRRVPPTSKR